MADEQENQGVTNTADPQGQGQTEAASQPDTGEAQVPAAGEQQQADAGQEPGQGPIPYDRFKAVNDKAKAAEERAQLLEQQIALYQANSLQGQGQPQPQQQPQEPDYFEGIEPDEFGYVRQDDVKKAMNRFRSDVGRQAQTLGFIATHPDFADVVGADGKYAPELQDLCNKNPGIVEQIRTSPNPLAAAYHFGKLAKQATANRTPPANQQVQNVQAPNPTSPSALGGSGGGFSPDSRWNNASLEDIDAELERIYNQR